MLQNHRIRSQRIVKSWLINEKRRQMNNEMMIAIVRINIEGKNLFKIFKAKMREEAIGNNTIIIVKTTLRIVVTNQEIDMIVERTVVKEKIIIRIKSSTTVPIVVKTKSMKNMVGIIITEAHITTIAVTIQIQFKIIQQEEEDRPR